MCVPDPHLGLLTARPREPPKKPPYMGKVTLKAKVAILGPGPFDWLYYLQHEHRAHTWTPHFLRMFWNRPLWGT